MERIEGLVREGQAMSQAWDTGDAMSDGKALRKKYDAWQGRLRLAPGEKPGTLTDKDEATIAYIIRGWARTPREVS